jgi:stearoyl-CoA desaturase (delta-9 desaturase)
MPKTSLSSVPPRSLAIPRSWRSLDLSSLFSAIIYPAVGVLLFLGALAAGLTVDRIHFGWWYPLASLAVFALTVFLCNQGIGPLHRIWQHRAGHLRLPAQVFVMLNCVLAMQGRLTDWVNYHAQHHRHSDEPGDPHNPAESKFWAWIGWLLWRDPEDMKRPMANWLSRLPIARFTDRHYLLLTVLIHFVLPAVLYALVFALGGSLLLAAMLHGAAVMGRAAQFHATTLGINVIGHMKAPAWLTWTLALLTGGEAFHSHHHDFPRSALHLPKRGIINRLVDYNGTVLLIFHKLKLATDLHIAPQFQTAPARA